MNVYLARLKAAKANVREKPLTGELTKPPKAPQAPLLSVLAVGEGGVFAGNARVISVDQDAIEERAGLCAGSIPAPYLDAWGALNHCKLLKVSDEEWWRALDDGGRFLDAWGNEAAEWGWTPDELFSLPRDGRRGGLLWFIGGAKVEAFGPDYASLDDDRIFDRGTVGCEWTNAPRAEN